MARKKRKNSYKKYSVTATVVFIFILVVIAVVYYFYSKKYNDDNALRNSSSVASDSLTHTAQNVAISTVTGLFNGGTMVDAAELSQDDLQNYGTLKVHFVDVGQGDGIILQFPNGQNMLIDAGPKKNVSKLTDYIDELGISTFDYVIATHQDEDHIGGMATVFEKYQVNYVFRPCVYSTYSEAKNLPENFNVGSKTKKPSTTKTYYGFLKAVVDEGCDWTIFNKDSDLNLSFMLDSVEYSLSFDFLTPTADAYDISYSDPNDYSPIIMLEYADYQILFTGDAEKTSENEFVSYYKDSAADYDVDLLKVGHHGSETSSSQAILDIVKPEYTVISCGKGNDYKHPRMATLQRLVEIGAKIFRTDVQGTVTLTVNPDGTFSFATAITDYKEADLYIGGDVG